MVNTVNALAKAAPSSKPKTQAATDGSRDAFRSHLDAARTQGNDNTNKLSVKKASRMKQFDQGWESLKIQPESEKDETSETDATNPAMANMVQGIVNILEAFGYLGGKVDEEALLGEITQILNNALPQGINANGNPDTALLNHIPNDKTGGTPVQQAAADILALLQGTQGQETGADTQASTLSDLQQMLQQASQPANPNILPGYMKKAIEKIIKDYASPLTGTQETADAEKGSGKTEKAGNDLILWMLKAALKEKGGTATQAAADPAQNATPAKTQTGNDAFAAIGNGAKQPLSTDTQAAAFADGLKGTPKETQENIVRIIDKIQASADQGKQEFTVQLKPEYLGRLSIKLVMNSDGISAHIKTADLGAHGLISDQLNTLQQALKDKGINLVNMDVKYDAAAFDMSGFQQERQNWDWSGNKKSIRYAFSSDLPVGSLSYEAMTDDQRLTAYNHSVEFKA